MDVLIVDNVTKFYGETRALDNVSFAARKGEAICILGPNGSGKTTLLGIIAGLIKPSKGKILIFGKDISEDPKILENVGALIGDSNLYDWITPRKLLKYFQRLKNIKKDINHYLKEFQLDKVGDKPAKKLSTGQRRRMILAALFMWSPELLILDEPFKGIDPLFQTYLKNLFKEYTTNGGTILMSSNILIMEEICAKYVFLSNGKMVFKGEFKDFTKILPSVVTIKAKILGNTNGIEKLEHVKSVNKFRETVEITVEREKVREVLLYLLENYQVLSYEIKELTLEDVLKQVVSHG